MRLLICAQAVDRTDPILGFFHAWIIEFSTRFERVDVICLRAGEYDLPSHVHVHSLGKEGGENRLKYVVKFYYYFTKIFLVNRVDYVFFHMGAIFNVLAVPFFLIRDFFGARFYWWKAHGHINWFGRCASWFVDRIYTSTESGFPIATEKRRVVGQAIDTELFYVNETETKRNRTVVFVGRVTPIKRIEDIIETASLLKNQGYTFSYEIIGPIIDADYHKNLCTRIEQLNLETIVTFMGPKEPEELISIFRTSKFFLNTSVTHSMDKALLEASLCGVVPITGNRAFRELLPSPLYIEQGTPAQYAEAIMALEHEDLARLREEIRGRIVGSHSLHTFAKRIFES